jgi:pilus assembly protein CpaB
MVGRNWVIAAIAVMLGLIAVVIANAWFSGMEDKQQVAADGGVGQTTSIVVATQPLEFGAKLTQQNVKLQPWPNASIPQGAYRSLQDVLRGNPAVIRPLVPGEPILADKLSGPGGRATLAELIPPGMRAFSVPVDAVTGVAGFVLPGTMVDVILTRAIPGQGTNNEDIRSDVVLTNVQVLAIDQVASDKTDKPKVSRTATLAVSLLDAQRLTLANRMGKLSLALRQVESAAGAANPNMAVAETGGRTITGRQVTSPPMYVVRRDRGAGEGTPGPATPRRVMTGFSPASGTGPMPVSGPSMTVFRGAEPTVYPVSAVGGR